MFGPREQSIVEMICTGLSNKEIAWRTGTSPRTIETQVARILARSGVNSRAQLIVLSLTGERKWEG